MKQHHTLGTGPVEQQFRETMAEIARTIDYGFNGNGPKNVGFVLMVFPFEEMEKGGRGRCNYMSNARREDIIALFKEQLSYFEGQSDKHGPGHA